MLKKTSYGFTARESEVQADVSKLFIEAKDGSFYEIRSSVHASELVV